MNVLPVFCVKYPIIFLFTMLAMTRTDAQKIAIEPGIGFGSSLVKDQQSNKGRIAIGFTTYYKLNERVSVGIELSTGGSFVNSIGGNSRADIYDASTNTITKDAAIMSAWTALGKVHYYFGEPGKHLRSFAEMGIGVNTYSEKVFNIPSYPEEKISRTSFAIQPGFGAQLGPFVLSMRYMVAGRTPAFTGIDDAGTTITYIPVRISPLYVFAGFRFTL